MEVDTPAKVIGCILNDALVPCYDYRMMCEYREVLERPKFGFSKGEIHALLDWFESMGRSVVAEPCDSSFIDEGDKKFYEVATFCHAKLITGHLKHFPDDPDVLSVAEPEVDRAFFKLDAYFERFIATEAFGYRSKSEILDALLVQYPAPRLMIGALTELLT